MLAWKLTRGPLAAEGISEHPQQRLAEKDHVLDLKVKHLKRGWEIKHRGEMWEDRTKDCGMRE